MSEHVHVHVSGCMRGAIALGPPPKQTCVHACLPSMQVFKRASAQVCKCAQVCKYANTLSKKTDRPPEILMYTCILAYLHTSILAYLHTCILAYSHTRILAYLHTCILAYVHACILAYLHTIEKDMQEERLVHHELLTASKGPQQVTSQ